MSLENIFDSLDDFSFQADEKSEVDTDIDKYGRTCGFLDVHGLRQRGSGWVVLKEHHHWQIIVGVEIFDEGQVA